MKAVLIAGNLLLAEKLLDSENDLCLHGVNYFVFSSP